MIKHAILTLAALAAGLSAQSAPSGQMKVDGKTTKFANVYAYMTEGFFDKKKDDTVVMLSDRPLTDAQMRDEFSLRRMATDGN